MQSGRTSRQGKSLNQTSRPEPLTLSLEKLITRARAMIDDRRRRILGITGPPGTGKSTLASALIDALGSDAVLVGMDGFHLANQELVRLGRRERKGAPDTFDVDGYASLLGRLREQREGTIYAPLFDRDLEESIGSAVPVSHDTPLVITEGNYLLFDDFGWQGVRSLLDDVWFLEIDAEERTDRLVRRRQGHGHEEQAAARWVEKVDTPNARLVEGTRHRADLIVRLAST